MHDVSASRRAVRSHSPTQDMPTHDYAICAGTYTSPVSPDLSGNGLVNHAMTARRPSVDATAAPFLMQLTRTRQARP
eukprot:2692431-Prymnesium_polylepis.1